MEKNKQQRIDCGYKIYENFVKKIKEDFNCPNLALSNPCSSSAEKFYLLGEASIHQLLAEMMREFSQNFEDDIFVKDGKLRRSINTSSEY